MTPSVFQAELFIDNRATHGEGPVWDAINQVLYWVDITSCRLHSWSPGAVKERTYQFQEPVCAVAPITRDRMLIAFAKRLAYVNLPDLSIEQICQVEPDIPGNLCNDGKMDPAGRFWIGTMSNDESITGSGSLYRLDQDGQLTRVLENLTISNGMGWSRDLRTMYFIDSPTREVWAFDFDPVDSSITNRRTVVKVPEDLGLPDGMDVGYDGTLWVAHWGPGCVCQWCPLSGKLLTRINTGCPHTSACCFGGDDGKKLFITTSRLELFPYQIEENPCSGSLFRYHPSANHSDYP
ncbi:MAG: SMP-30/gluconolactonase/LRE family protein [Verrucomicrobia bacterium]|nr:SMP-30/gluconolactonase/LRE family protein [Verrucomicrobiota bacterium]